MAKIFVISIESKFLTACISLVQTSRDRDNKRPCTSSRKELRRYCSPIGHNNTKLFYAQSGDSIRLTVCKWSGKSRYPGAFPPMLENFRRAFSPRPTDCTWVSEDGVQYVSMLLLEIMLSAGQPADNSIICKQISLNSCNVH